MRVVSARVHLAFDLGGKWHAASLARSVAHPCRRAAPRRTRRRAAYDAATMPVFRHAAVFDSQGVEFALDEAGRLVSFETEFGAAVDRAPQLDNASGYRFVYCDGHCERFYMAVLAFPPAKRGRAMMTADLAFALLMNRTSAYYQANPPVYMTYDEHTHVSAPTLGRTQDIDRSIAVRVADNVAVMRDLPNGGERTGPGVSDRRVFRSDFEVQVSDILPTSNASTSRSTADVRLPSRFAGAGPDRERGDSVQQLLGRTLRARFDR